MKQLSLVTIVLCTLLKASAVSASMALIVPLSSFRITADSIEVSGAQSDTGITELKVRAFGRTYEISGAQLKPLKGMKVSGVELASEGRSDGPRASLLGGRWLYVILHGTTRAQIILTERGDVTVEKPTDR